MIKKFVGILVVLAVIAGVVVMFGRNTIAKVVIESVAYKATGLKVSIGKINVGLRIPQVRVTDLTVKNPAGFQQPDLLVIPAIYARYDRKALLRMKLHLYELRMQLQQMTIEKNAQKEYNLQKVKAAVSESPAMQGQSSTEYKIDLLVLTIGKAMYYDYSGKSERKKEYNIGINEEEFRNVSSFDSVVKTIVWKVLTKTSLKMPGMVLDGAASKAKAAVGTAKAEAGKATSTAKDAASKVKGLLGGN